MPLNASFPIFVTPSKNVTSSSASHPAKSLLVTSDTTDGTTTDFRFLQFSNTAVPNSLIPLALYSAFSSATQPEKALFPIFLTDEGNCMFFRDMQLRNAHALTSASLLFFSNFTSSSALQPSNAPSEILVTHAGTVKLFAFISFGDNNKTALSLAK